MDSGRTSPTRREVLQALPAAAAACVLAHDPLGQEAPPAAKDAERGGRVEAGEPLIRRLRLLTAAPLDDMREFYEKRIGFPVLEQGDAEISFAAGATRLTFVTATREHVRGDGGRGDGKPFYHFAFNIPQNKLRAARAWQLERTALVPPQSGLVDPEYENDVWHVRAWNAHSVFFFDPAFNIVEYIARHDLKNDAPTDDGFSTADIHYASEIGFVVQPSTQRAAAGRLHEKLGLEAYPRRADPPWAMGDERGLLLCLARKGQMWGANTATPVKWAEFPTEVTVRGRARTTFEIDGLPYRVSVE
jgi:hypothetical protein